MVYNSVLKKSLIFIPAVTLPFFTGFNKVNASPIQQVMGSGINIFEPVDSLVENISKLVNGVMIIVEWFQNLPTHIASLSVSLLVKIFEILMLVLQTPLFIFNNSYIKDVSLVLSGISVLIVTILTMFEGIKRMLKMRSIDLETIGKRYFIASLGAGVAPIAFEKAFQLINGLVKAITKIGAYEITPNFIENSLNPKAFDWFHTILLLGFDIMLIAMMIPILLQNGRRFFDLMCLSALTPLALTSWVFDDYKHMFKSWWENVKILSVTPITYSIFVVLLGLFLFGTRNVVDGGGLLVKFIIILGGISRLADPPNFVKAKVDRGGDIVDSYNDTKKVLKETWDTISLKKIRKNIPKLKKKK